MNRAVCENLTPVWGCTNFFIMLSSPVTRQSTMLCFRDSVAKINKIKLFRIKLQNEHNYFNLFNYFEFILFIFIELYHAKNIKNVLF